MNTVESYDIHLTYFKCNTYQAMKQRCLAQVPIKVSSINKHISYTTTTIYEYLNIKKKLRIPSLKKVHLKISS